MIGYIITVWGNRMVLVDYHEDDAFDGIQMRRLQLVDTKASLLEHSIMTMKSLNLIWICLNRHPNSSLPSWILMKNLRLLIGFYRCRGAQHKYSGKMNHM